MNEDRKERRGLFGGLFGRKKKDDAPEATEPESGEELSQAPLEERPAEAPELERDAVEAEIAPSDRAAEAEGDGAERSDAPSPPVAHAAPQEASTAAIAPEPDAAAREAAAVAEDAPAPPADDRPGETGAGRKGGFFSRLKDGLSKTSAKLAGGVASIFTKRKLDDEALEELEDLLITADLGVAAAARIVQALAKGRYDKEVSENEVKAVLADEVAKTLAPLEAPLKIDPALKPHVILVAGVNGAGKTTTIGKLAKSFREDGKSVMLAAGDTFRAAAIEQLQVWGERVGAPVLSRPVGSDAAGLAFDALTEAKKKGVDVLMIDTAGRLQNKKELMDELAKVVRVVKKVEPDAPHSSILVLDATVGQNALSQAEAFKDVAGTTGLVMTKLDGTARGGVLVALADKHRIPIHYIGVGEGADGLQPFDARAFARALAGLEDNSD